MFSFDIWRKKPPLCTHSSKSSSGENKPVLVCAIYEFCDRRHPSCDKLPTATAIVIMFLHRSNSGVLDFPPVLQSSKSLALFCHIHLPFTGNLLIDGWGRYRKWQQSLCRWFSFKCICHLAGGGKDERQLSWTLNRQRDTCGLAMPHWQGVKSEGWMIDRDLKWKRDTHLLSHHAYSHNVCNSRWLKSGLV